MFRNTLSKLSLRKKVTILASVGVFLPVLILTYMQYRSLAELENKTKGAFKDNLRQGFTILQRQMKQRLEDVAAQTLEPIASLQLSSLSSPPGAKEIEKYFANVKRSHPEIKEIFAFAYSDGKQETNSYAYLYSDEFMKIAQAEFTPAQSHLLSLFDRSRTGQNFLDDNRNYLFAHHSCPTCPPSMREGTYLFYPLKDLTDGEPSGFAGVLLNEGFVRDDLIARTIERLSTNHASTSHRLSVACSYFCPRIGHLELDRFLPQLFSRKPKKAKSRLRANRIMFPSPKNEKRRVNDVERRFERAVKNAKIADFHFHDLRHTAATRMADAGADPFTLAAFSVIATFG